MKFLFFMAFSIPVWAASTKPEERLEVVPRVDIERYLGKWYDIAHLPQKFQRGCANTTATYSLRDDGDIAVLNYCLKPDGEDRAKGKAWVVDPSTNAKLKVQFFWPFRGDYWIIELGEQYEYAVVGEPSRKYLWVLSREPKMDPATLESILARQGAKGFPIDKIELTSQSETIEPMAAE